MSDPRATEALRVGAGSAVITPDLGAHLAGYFEARRAAAVHDDLGARALAFDDGRTRAALVICDLICLPAEVVAQVRAAAAAASGIPAAHVMVGATHTHTGPQTRLTHLQEEEGGPTRRWLSAFPERAAAAVQAAIADLEPCAAAWASAAEDRIAFNRRYRMKDGTVRTNPGQQHPDILGPAGPVDPEVGVAAFRRRGGNLKALLVSYACHLDNVGGKEISADFPGYLARRLAERLPGRPFTLYANGACGDINHIDARSAVRRQGHEHSRWMGETLAGDVCEALPAAVPMAAAPVRVVARPVALPVREGADPVSVEIQGIRVGGLGIVGIPAEYFVELQLEIKRRSPLAQTVVCELANGWVGYVPTRRAFEENMGHVPAARMEQFDHLGYEVRSALSRGFVPGVGEAMGEAALGVLEELAR